uniref:GLOBIN domain-containing protein n=1 Tax=Panagrellus redivivus TaxID=6233 RepID=A0A7E4UWK4_PANRE
MGWAVRECPLTQLSANGDALGKRTCLNWFPASSENGIHGNYVLAMIGATTARLRIARQQQQRGSSQTNGKDQNKRRSQSPGGRKQPNNLSAPKPSAAALRRRSCTALLAASSPVGSPMTSSKLLKVPENGIPMRKRSGSVPCIRFTLAIAWNIKSDHVRALKLTWTRLCDVPRSNCKGIVAIMEKVFEKFESKQKTLKEVFYNSAFVDSMQECRHAAAAANINGASCGLRRKSNNQNIATLRDHIHFFVSLISQVIHNLDSEPQEIFEHIDKIGCYHAQLRKYGFQASMFDKLGECLIDALAVQDNVRSFPDACKAWTILVAALVDRLRSAPKHMAALPVTGRILTRPDPVPAPFGYRRISPT